MTDDESDVGDTAGDGGALRLGCGHAREPAEVRLCPHLATAIGAGDIEIYWWRPRGAGAAHDLICDACEHVPSEVWSWPVPTVPACASCTSRLEASAGECMRGSCLTTTPLERTGALSITHAEVALDLGRQRLVAVAPVPAVPGAVPGATWVGLTGSGRLLRLDLDAGSVEALGELADTVAAISAADDPRGHPYGGPTPEGLAGLLAGRHPIALAAAPGGGHIALFAIRGRAGAVVESTTGEVVAHLDRGGYFPEQTDFPIAWTASPDGRALLIHGAAWNRLEVWDPEAGTVVPGRPTDDQRFDHANAYFRGGLAVSADAEWIAEDGWMWHPTGETIAWSLRHWLAANPSESDDGESRRRLAWRENNWGIPLCFVGHLLCEAAVGNWIDEEDRIAGVTVYDLDAGDPPRVVIGPLAPIFDVGGLLASGGGNRLELWELADGARVGTVEDFVPDACHPDTGELVAWRPDGRFRRLTIRTEPQG